MDVDPSDILFLVFVILLAISILNNGNWGGGRRVRNDDRTLVPAAWPA